MKRKHKPDGGNLGKMETKAACNQPELIESTTKPTDIGWRPDISCILTGQGTDLQTDDSPRLHSDDFRFFFD